MSLTDPRDIIDQSAMTRLQVIVIALTIGLNALDGFDVLAISFASSGIVGEWMIDRTTLGVVLSAELLGMAVGSITLGGVADNIGRRKTILGCLVVMSIGMFMVTTASTITELLIWRVFTGLGIGGMLAAINATAAEFSNSKRRHLSVSLMAIGYPVGGVVGGLIVGQLLGGENPDWRSVFYFGAAVTALFIPLFYFIVPESVHWLTTKRPEGALEKINDTLSRLGHSLISSLPEEQKIEQGKSKTGGAIFSKELIFITCLVTGAYFLHITTFYFVIKWIPDIVTRFGFHPSEAAGVLTWASVGGAVGGGLFGILTTKFDLRKLTIGSLVLGATFVTLFGQTPADLTTLSALVLVAGIFTNAAIVGLYAIVAQVYPTHARATGTGFVIGVGRGGSFLAPIIAGILFQFGLGLPVIAGIMACGSLLAAVALLFLKIEKPEASKEQTA